MSEIADSKVESLELCGSVRIHFAVVRLGCTKQDSLEGSVVPLDVRPMDMCFETERPIDIVT